MAAVLQGLPRCAPGAERGGLFSHCLLLLFNAAIPVARRHHG